MIDELLVYFAFYFLWLVIHESAHIFSALILRLKIRGLGVRIKPIPHIYTEIDGNVPQWEKILFTISGASVILLLWTFFYLTNNDNQALQVTLSLQLILDTNPFYSDVQVLNSMQRTNNNASKNGNYLFSNIGLIHFSTWAILIFFMLNHLKAILI